MRSGGGGGGGGDKKYLEVVFISGNFYFSFVSTSLTLYTLPCPKTKEKQQLPEIEN